MSLCEEMQGLVEGIVSVSEARAEGISQIRRETQAQLQELDGAHNGMAQELRAELAKVKPALDEAEAARRQDEAQEARERAQVVAQRKSDVGAQLQGHRVELAGGRAAWQRMATLHGERAGISKASEAAERISGLRERVFGGLADHPDGLRLTEIERQYGMSRFESNRAVKGLMENGKVEKRGLLYFAI